MGQRSQLKLAVMVFALGAAWADRAVSSASLREEMVAKAKKEGEVVFMGDLFVATPLALLVVNSFRTASVGDLGFFLTDLTLHNYVEAYSDPHTLTMLFNSLWFALGSMVVAMIFGCTLAFLCERTDLRFRHLIPALIMIPLIMPGVVKGIAWLFLLSPKIGILNRPWTALFGGPLFDSHSIPAMIWVEGVSMSPLAFLLVGSIIQRMDPALEEAGAGSGASRWKVLLHVTLPLLMPAVAGVALLLFIRGIEAFEIPILMGTNAGIFVFSTNIYHALREASPPEYGLAFSYCMTLILLTVAALCLYQRQLRRTERYAVVMGKGYRPRLIHLGNWSWLGWAFLGFYAVVGVLLPFFVLLWASLLPYYQPPSLAALSQLTLVNYATVLNMADLWDAAKNTIILGLTSSVASMFLTALASWFLFRTQLGCRKLLDFVLFLPYALPGMIVGVAFMILFLSFKNPIYNTIWIVVLAHIVNFLPIGSRFTHAAVVQVHKELEEAASASGAGFWRILRYVWLPLLLPALMNGTLFLLILSFKVMSAAALLQGPNSMVLSVYLWNLWNGGEGGLSSALSVLMITILALLTIISRRVGRSAAAVHYF